MFFDFANTACMGKDGFPITADNATDTASTTGSSKSATAKGNASETADPSATESDGPAETGEDDDSAASRGAVSVGVLVMAGAVAVGLL